MEIRPLKLAGTFTVILAPRKDARGHFGRLFDADIWAAHGLPVEFAQENEAFTAAKHTLRGLHFQRPPHAETKIVRCARGAVLDAFVDLRAGSLSYGKWDSLVLSADEPAWVVIPKGFAHGYCTLTPDTLVQYKVDRAYAPEAEGGVPWDDPDIGIEWPSREPILSERDRAHPRLRDFVSPFADDIEW
ncbi:MAG: dTDP-4-dehydrorhamnose 3,5-epimerase [Tagaea sp.]|nr:dTDP-4-dehydrorhamnose 3,5-epimerase [Tagaea sp.]